MTSLGFVCSLDAVPLMAAACFTAAPAWRIACCSGYGSIIRQIKSGRLAGGLLPLDLFATEFLTAHVPVQPWRILTLQTAQPRELVVSNAARGLLKPSQQSSTLPFRIALDGLDSFTQRAVEAWVRQHVPHIQPRATYKVLPLNAIHQGMETTMIEAFAAPAPWGLMAQYQDLGMLQPDFRSTVAEESILALVIHSRHAVAEPATMKQIPEALVDAHTRLSTPAGHALAIELLSAPAPCAFPSQVLQEALSRAPALALPAPASISKIAARLAHLVKAGVWRGNALSNERLAQSLSVF
jgi:hypothetical protein